MAVGNQVIHQIKIEQFEGPLDLLLQLIEDEKLEITKVSLAQVTEQYIKVLNQRAKENVRAEELADFLAIAARLLLIKSRALLPFLQWGEEDEGEELTQQLKIYREYLQATKTIAALINKKHFSFARQKLLISQEVEFSPPPSLTAPHLAKTFAEILRTIDPLINLPSEIIRKTISIQEKINQIRERLFKQAQANFSDILREAHDKTEVIVSFLALLELIKQRAIVVRQTKTFEDISIERV